jgi:hypothetical protein
LFIGGRALVLRAGLWTFLEVVMVRKEDSNP